MIILALWGALCACMWLNDWWIAWYKRTWTTFHNKLSKEKGAANLPFLVHVCRKIHHINYHPLESSWVSLVSLELQTMNFSQFADYFKFCLCSLSLVVNECWQLTLSLDKLRLSLLSFFVSLQMDKWFNNAIYSNFKRSWAV